MKHTIKTINGELKTIEPYTRSRAIKEKCKQCTAESRVEIRDCHITDCALWCYRPYQKEESVDGVVKPKRTRKMTEEQRKAASERMKVMRKKGIGGRKKAVVSN